MCRAVESELHKSTAKGSARESGASTKGPFLYQVRSEKNVVDKKVHANVRFTNTRISGWYRMKRWKLRSSYATTLNSTSK
jgi:hypothetical protein